jgi:hypothetical protein
MPTNTWVTMSSGTSRASGPVAVALSYPLSLAGPIVGARYLIGFGVMVYLMKRRNDSLDRLAESVDPEPTPVLAAQAA